MMRADQQQSTAYWRSFFTTLYVYLYRQQSKNCHIFYVLSQMQEEKIIQQQDFKKSMPQVIIRRPFQFNQHRVNTSNRLQAQNCKKSRPQVTIRKQKRTQKFNQHRANTSNHLQAQNCKEINIVLDRQLENQITSLHQKAYNSQDTNWLIIKLESQNIIEKYEGVIGIRKIIFNTSKEFLRDIITAPTIRTLLALANSQWTQLQFEAVSILGQIACMGDGEANIIFTNNGVPILLTLTASNVMEIRKKSIQCLGDLSEGSIYSRNLIIKNKGVALLLKHLNNKQTRFESYSALIKVVSTGNPLPKFQDVFAGLQAICLTLRLQQAISRQIIVQSLVALTKYLKPNPDHMGQIIEKQLTFQRLVRIINLQEEAVTQPCLVIISCISESTLLNLQSLGKTDIISILYQILSVKSKLRQKACQILSNLIKVQSLFPIIVSNEKLMNRLTELIQIEDYEIKVQICAFFTNMCYIQNRGLLLQIYRKYSWIWNLFMVIEVGGKHTLQLLCHLDTVLQSFSQSQTQLNLMVEQIYKNSKQIILQQLQESQQQISDKVTSIIVRFFTLEEPTQI